MRLEARAADVVDIPTLYGLLAGHAKSKLVFNDRNVHRDLQIVAGITLRHCGACDFHETANLMDMKNSMPAWLWYDADGVIKDGLEAVEKGKPVYLSGRLYRQIQEAHRIVVKDVRFLLSGEKFSAIDTGKRIINCAGPAHLVAPK